MNHGDFTGLAQSYSLYRPTYSASVLNCLLSLLDKPINESSFADIGAGTGIWTRMLHEKFPKIIDAVEPNDDMRNQGEKDSRGTAIQWIKGTGENTGLHDD